MDNTWKQLSEEIVYENPWIKVSHEDVIAPTGHKGIYGKVHYKNYAIGILPLDDDHNTWLVGQHRYPIDTYSWEMPEGGGLVGQDILESAKRELREEVGLEAKHWQEIQRLHLSNSVSDEIAILFVATGLKKVPIEPDETEVLEIKKVSFEEAFQMVWNGEITDTMTVNAIFRVKRMKELGEL